MKKISINNGATYCSPAEALEAITLETMTAYMDPETMETVNADLAPCTELEFLTRYLEIAPDDLVVG